MVANGAAAEQAPYGVGDGGEGLVLGGSSGVNVAGAIHLARDLGPGKTIETILADGGIRYQSKLFNPEFLRAHNLPVPPWIESPEAIKAPLV